MALSQLRGFALLAGRKLLLADDSITIQKVVALTFADEGIEVLAVNNGADAIDKLEEFWPDIVLADVFMPKKSGLQVCEYVKTKEQLKHIPVMLLVGSFEPLDEAEARRVGADDILTKPFQSIRTLVDKVGALLGREPAHDDPESAAMAAEEPLPVAEPTPVAEPAAAPEQAMVSEFDGAATMTDYDRSGDGVRTLDGAETLEFADQEMVHVQGEPMDAADLQLATADTRPLSPEMRSHFAQSANERALEKPGEEEKMETHLDSEPRPQTREAFGDVLLDLGDFEAAPAMSADDVVLDIDFDSPAPERHHAPADDWQAAVAVETPVAAAVRVDDGAVIQPDDAGEWHPTTPESSAPLSVSEDAIISDSAAPEFARETGELSVSAPVDQEFHGTEPAAPVTTAPAAATPVVAPAAEQITLAQLSPEAVDAIARRVVEHLSENVVQEIAWEVVPRLAELLIKQKLEELK